MITFNNLGQFGRLGNQMFQYAALRGIAAHRGFDYSIDRNSILYEGFLLPESSQISNFNTINKLEKFDFDSTFFNTCPDNIDIVGYFQTEKYFQHIEKQIRKDFTFKDNIIKTCTMFFDGISKQEKLALHVRRGDYLNLSNYFVNLDLEYYHNALSYFDSKLQVIVFSDDSNWCSKQDLFKNKQFIISNLSNQFLDLCAMSMCDYHIMANSSFSWWGSWLAKSKKTVAPKEWFAGEFKNWNTKDLYLSNWIIV